MPMLMVGILAAGILAGGLVANIAGRKHPIAQFPVWASIGDTIKSDAGSGGGGGGSGVAAPLADLGRVISSAINPGGINTGVAVASATGRVVTSTFGTSPGSGPSYSSGYLAPGSGNPITGSPLGVASGNYATTYVPPSSSIVGAQGSNAPGFV